MEILHSDSLGLPFVDLHTHHQTNAAAVVSVLNFSQKDFENDQITEGAHFRSAGLHPWFLNKENFKYDFEKLTQLVQNQNVIAIGECGLDKLKGEDMAFQTRVFDDQIHLAESVSKPVVIHCVRAFGEIIAVKKRLIPAVPLIIHGFNKNEAVLTELLHHDFFISIGSAILLKNGQNTEGEMLAKIIHKIPLDRLFFETDEAENVPISEIYAAAAKALDLDLSNLKSIIHRNFKATFST
jgi:TatD DNase family protein